MCVSVWCVCEGVGGVTLISQHVPETSVESAAFGHLYNQCGKLESHSYAAGLRELY